MTQATFIFSEIRYNPEAEGFETHAATTVDSVTYVYPVWIRAPLTAGSRFVARELLRKARDAHANHGTRLHMQRPSVQGPPPFRAAA